MNRIKCARATRLVVGGILAALMFCAPAAAERGHVFDRSFGEPGSSGGQFVEPQALAVSETSGDVYVVDRGGNRVERFSSTGTYLGQFDGSGSFENEGVAETGTAAGSGGLPGEIETGQFSRPEAIAVDNACQLHKPHPLTSATTPTCASFDESAGDVYLVDAGHSVIDKFDATGHYLGQIAAPPDGPFSELHGVAVDSTGKVWVADEHFNAEANRVIGVEDYSSASINRFVGFRRTGSFGFETLGFGVDSEEDFYLNETDLFTSAVAKYSSDGTLLNGAVDTEGTNAVAAELTTDQVYLDHGAEVRRLTPDGGRVETLTRSGLVSNGVTVNATQETVYVADAAAQEVDIFAREEPSAPTIEGTGASDVSAEAALLVAEINPRGSSTTFKFEYGPCEDAAACATSAYTDEAPTPEGSVGSDFEVHIKTQRVDLEPATTYHYRVTARNAHGPVTSAERVITTQPPQNAGLPDGRAWELVSPVNKHGAFIEPIGETGVIQASAAGDAMTYLANAPTELEPQGASNRAQVVSTRAASGGWSSLDIAIPHSVATGASVGPGVEFRQFSANLSEAILQPLGAFEQGLSPDASEQTPYVRNNYPGPAASTVCAGDCFQPLITSLGPEANVAPGIQFGEEGRCPQDSAGQLKLLCGPLFESAAADLKHTVIMSEVPLLAGITGPALYERGDGALAIVSLLPNKEQASGPQIGPGPGDLESRNEISEDGSRVIWRSAPGLYMRDMSNATTIQLDAAEPACEAESACTSGGGVFQIASKDGSIVYFTDAQRLTKDSGASENRPDLYRCDIVVSAGTPVCHLSDVTPESEGESASVQGAVLGIGDDGRSVYFVANGSLGTGAPAGDCEGRKENTTCNLYVHTDGGTRSIAVLGSEDRPDWAQAPLGEGTLVGLTARVSPDGEWLAFMSDRQLTGYDNRDAESDQPDEEVFLYHASDRRVLCASCNPTGARPHGREYGPLRYVSGGLVGGSEIWSLKQWIAANIPGWTPYRGGVAHYQSSYLTNTGRLYFNSSDALSAVDTNATEDVYQYEPDALGNCSATSGSYSSNVAGCIDLVSSGKSSSESAFLDASSSGSDVFFLTAARLSSQDVDSNVDVYDAHECSASAPCAAVAPVQPAECEEGAACRPTQPGGEPPPPSPTATVQGDGNVSSAAPTPKPSARLTRAQMLAKALKACKKQHGKKQRGACERRARSKYGPVHHAAKKKQQKRRATNSRKGR